MTGQDASKLALLKLLHKLGLIEARSIPSAESDTEHFPIAYFAKKGFIEEKEAMRRVAEVLGIEVQDLGKASQKEILPLLNQPVFEKTPLTRWTRMRALPVHLTPVSLVVAMANPLDHENISALSFDLGRRIETRIAREDEILKILGAKQNAERHEEIEALFEHQTSVDDKQTTPDTNLGESDHNAAPIVRIVNKIISDALEAHASDIHINPEADVLNVRIRVDGIMRPLLKVPKGIKVAVISRLKLIGGMDISERRRPQDGRLRVQSTFGNIDLRISSVPTPHGENIVVRILAAESPLVSFDALGMDPEVQRHLQAALRGSSKVVLVSGPTGSGKTSTLYASLSYLNDGTRNIITVEDPIEYRIAGLSQIQVNPKIGLGFAEGLRSILRQDPDIIMVGEIRDNETAGIAAQAAQTGHLVLSTIHTNTAAAAVTRLRDLNVPPYLVSSSLGCVLAQRLVRRLCSCAASADSPSDRDSLPRGIDLANLKKPQGCDDCGMTGYRGRIGIYSILPVTRDVGEVIKREGGEHELENAARPAGFLSLWEAGAGLISAGLTSYEEVLRVVGPPETGGIPQMEAVRSAHDNVQPLARRKVLLIEDDEDVRAVLVMLLKANLYDVSEAANGLEGLEKVYESKPEVIVCDLMMPAMNGMDFVRRLRNDARIKSIPVLILTAANTDDNQVSALQFGADDFVAKTADSRILLARVEKLFEKTGR